MGEVARVAGGQGVGRTTGSGRLVLGTGEPSLYVSMAGKQNVAICRYCNKQGIYAMIVLIVSDVPLLQVKAAST